MDVPMYFLGARGSVVVGELRYKLEGRVFENRKINCISSIYLILLAALEFTQPVTEMNTRKK
jgi:hypothetical protein